MTDLELELSAEIIKSLRRLATHLHGDASEDAIARTLQDSAMMYLMWLERVGHEVAKKIEDPVADFEFESPSDDEQTNVDSDIANLLFRGGE